MNGGQSDTFRVLVIAIVALIVGYTVATGNALAALIAVIGGIFLLSLAKRRVNEVFEDERIHRVSERASRKTLQVFGAGIALIGVLLISYGFEVGYALAFSACALAILYLTFYAILSKGEIS